MKILLIGDAQHGKDTVGDMFQKLFGLKSEASSLAALRIFLYDKKKEELGWTSLEHAFEDRVNHRSMFYDEIVAYNNGDYSRLAREITETNDIYTGLRAYEEIKACHEQGVFDHIIHVHDPRKPREPMDSLDRRIFDFANIVIVNDSNLNDLESAVKYTYQHMNGQCDKGKTWFIYCDDLPLG